MENNISHIKNCTACSSCLNVCPTHAICLGEEDCFFKIKVDKTKCISCGKCLSVCPLNSGIGNTNPIVAYGLSNKETNLLLKSSSGGFFVSLAAYVLKHKGYVYGATYLNFYSEVAITEIHSESEIFSLLKSKYVESKVGNSFAMAKKRLSDGNLVLYCGTPCQVAGLKTYLGKDFSNLITCDFACGGLPSHSIFKFYLQQLCKKYNSSIKSVDFRPKSYGWSKHSILIEFSNGKKYKNLSELDPYFYNFLYTRYSIRDNCLSCVFTKRHQSDFTMADFWLYKELSHIKNNEKGISLIHCNTEKSLNIFELIKDNFLLENIDLEKSKYNFVDKPILSSSFYTKRNNFLSNCKNDFYNESVRYGMKKGFKAFVFKFKFFLKRCLRMKK